MHITLNPKQEAVEAITYTYGVDSFNLDIDLEVHILLPVMKNISLAFPQYPLCYRILMPSVLSCLWHFHLQYFHSLILFCGMWESQIFACETKIRLIFRKKKKKYKNLNFHLHKPYTLIKNNQSWFHCKQG